MHEGVCGGHFSPKVTAHCMIIARYYWPTIFKDAQAYVTTCDRCQRTGNISRRYEMPLNNILEVKLFDV